MPLNETTHIRDTSANDLSELRALYADAFPDENLYPLVKELLALSPPVLALTAEANGQPVGHILFIPCHVKSFDQPVALLGPLCVLPAKQKQGIASTLISIGFERLKVQGVTHVFVLGDPAYYKRYGFSEENDVLPPYPLPDVYKGGWQSICLGEDNIHYKGTLVVPEPWCKPALWSASDA